MMFPGIADAANVFAKTHRKINDCLEPLYFNIGKVLPMCQYLFSVSENPRERVVDLVAE